MLIDKKYRIVLGQITCLHFQYVYLPTYIETKIIRNAF